MVGINNIKIDILWEKSPIKLAKSDDICVKNGVFINKI